MYIGDCGTTGERGAANESKSSWNKLKRSGRKKRRISSIMDR